MTADPLVALLRGAIRTGDDTQLRRLLMLRSGLPGPRPDPALVEEFGSAVGSLLTDPQLDVDRLEALLDGWAALSPAEAPGEAPAVILPCAAVAGYGAAALARPDWRDDEIDKLRALATDPRRWVREAVAAAIRGVTAPVLFVIDDDRDSLRVVESELRKRYGADYRLVCETSVEAALATLERLRADGEQVALMLSDLWLADRNGVEFLGLARVLHPTARRVVTFDWGDRRAGSLLLRAGTLGEIDDWITKPWRDGDEHFHQAISAFLYDWAQAHQRGMEIVRVVGDQWSERTHRLRDMLSRNHVGFGFYTPDSATGQLLLKGVSTTRRPVVITFDGQTLVDPSNAEIAQALGIRVRPDPAAVYDLLIIGVGPAGTAAAVYAGSEGLRLAGIEREAVGGQASTSSMIRNYPGFPRGISGSELTARAFQQAGLFGADFVYAEATGLRTDGSHFVIDLRDAGEITGRAVIIATGVAYRRLDIPSLDRLLGKGVFYGAAAAEAPAMAGRRVFVVGGANSAGQAALHLSRHAETVTLLVRRSTLTETMSDYLIRQIEVAPNISVRYDVELVEGHGDDRLAGLTVRERSSAETDRLSADALFVLIGAEPHTAWLPESIRRDGQGFILTGPDLLGDGEPPTGRPPALFETSLPGVFAIGDVRHGSIKRVASAVGEGSVAVRLLHDHLAAARAADPSPTNGTLGQ